MASTSGFTTLGAAARSWRPRTRSRRRVVDVVCLVPDVPTFLAALSTWDADHYFPILIEDRRFSTRFTEAFRPARTIRFPRTAEPIPESRIWRAAAEAVGRAWSEDGRDPRGDASPAKSLGAVPPGVVVSAPGSSSLAGAAALAAGRFQPLLRWEPSAGYSHPLAEKEARRLAAELERKVGSLVPRYGRLGDDCDFLTLAGDYPYRYRKDGDYAFDDLVARDASGRRWGYAGRLMGGPAAAVYRAMCSLFLQPRSALLFNTYDDYTSPGTLFTGNWASYSQRTAAALLRKTMSVETREGEQADLPGWKSVFRPRNRFGLLLINTGGIPGRFKLVHGYGYTRDVPESVPTVLYKIHSLSAAAPHDPNTLAGSWLENGAYIYFGALEEPYLQSFRTPTLVSSLIVQGLPFAAAMRRADPLENDVPWRLVYLGDPLYQLAPAPAPRVPSWPPLEAWATGRR